MKSVAIIALTLLACVALNEAFQCYSHDACITTNCKPLSETVKTCASDEDRCYKGTLVGGVTRGCAKDRCNIQIDGGPLAATVCCEKDLCNSATTFTWTMGTLLMVVGAFVFARM